MKRMPMLDNAAPGFPSSRLRAVGRTSDLSIRHDLPALGSAASHHVDVRVHGIMSLTSGLAATTLGPLVLDDVVLVVGLGLLSIVVGLVHLLVEPQRFSHRSMTIGHMIAVVALLSCAVASGHSLDLSAGPMLIVIVIIHASCFRTSRETWWLAVWSLGWYAALLSLDIDADRMLGAVFLLAATLVPIVVTLTWLRARIDLLVAELRRLAEHDTLTGLLNREGLRRRAADISSVTSGGDGNNRLALFLLDVDRFKMLNDTNGHPAGDAALAWLGSQLRASVREPAMVARYGGEEFIVLLPIDCAETALARAEQIRRNVESASRDQPAEITVSIGVAVGRHDEQFADLYRRADLALYAAKQSGRNRVEWQPDDRVVAA